MESEARSDLINHIVLANFTYLPDIISPGHPIRPKSVLSNFVRRRWNGQLIDLRCSWAAAGKNWYKCYEFDLSYPATHLATWRNTVLLREGGRVLLKLRPHEWLVSHHRHVRLRRTRPFSPTFLSIPLLYSFPLRNHIMPLFVGEHWSERANKLGLRSFRFLGTENWFILTSCGQRMEKGIDYLFTTEDCFIWIEESWLIHCS